MQPWRIRWEQSDEEIGDFVSVRLLHRFAFVTQVVPSAVLRHASKSLHAGMAAKHVGRALFGLRHQPDSSGARAVVAGLVPAVASWRGAACRTVTLMSTGMRYQPASPATRRMLSVLGDSLDSGRFDNSAVCTMLFGLQAHDPSMEARKLLRCLLPHLRRLSSATVADVSAGFIGLQRQRTTAETEQTVAKLVGLLHGLGTVDDRAVSNILYGMHRLDSTPAVQSALAALTQLLATCNSLGPHAIANSLYGLRTQTDYCETRDLLHALAGKMQCTQTVDGQTVANALYGLSRQGDSVAVRRVLTQLLPLVRMCTGFDTGQHVASALYGLRMQSDTPVTRSLFEAISGLLKSSPPLRSRAVGVAMLGLAGQGKSAGTVAVFDWLVRHLPDSPSEITATQVLQVLGALRGEGFAVQEAAAKVAGGAQSAGSQLRRSLLLAGIDAPAPKHPMPPTTKPSPSFRERTGLAFDLRHESGFEMDLLCGRVNVELEGRSPSYRSQAKSRFFAERDRILQQRFGITVRRVQMHGYSLVQLVQLVGGHCGAGAGLAPDVQEQWDVAWLLAQRGWEYWLIELRHREEAAL
eukprot:TRINITY_DN5397_c0_g1_i1.p1 TRINITY_DN5397_c0_g1~~TRINITY_DN5397_c0_g1_i1.p1  ORF type:complete len:580 (+),score=123.32 TRINITY_DN5397_c0_g1_i1:153-1892(+)